MGPGFTAAIVRQLGVTSTAALVGRFEGHLTGDLVVHFGPSEFLSTCCATVQCSHTFHLVTKL